MIPCRKKIVYVIGSLAIGGAERYLVETASRLNRKRYIPRIYCLFGEGPLKSQAERQGVPVQCFHIKKREHQALKYLLFWRVRALFAFYRYLRRERPEIVHCYMYKPSIYGGIAAKLARVPFLITQRTSLGYFKEGRPWYQRIQNFVNRFTDRVITDSEAVKKSVVQQEEMNPDHIVVIHSGIDLHQFRDQGQGPEAISRRFALKRRLGIPEKAPVIGKVANIRRLKGYAEFILAAAEIQREYPEARFLCIGKDLGFQAELQTQIQQLNLEPKVMFTGEVEDVASFLDLFDILVVASYTEGSSIAAREAMAVGKPVVATSVGGIPEAVIHEHTGLLVPPQNSDALAQAILRLLRDPDCASRFGQNGRARIETLFSIENTVASIEHVYESLYRNPS